jgi:hypothetical protein
VERLNLLLLPVGRPLGVGKRPIDLDSSPED